MNNVMLCSATIGFVISLVTYGFGVWLHDKTKLDIMNPLLISIALTIVILLACKVDYKSYNDSAKYLSYLLTPATVCLAIPLYKQMALLKKNFRAILIGVLAGCLTSMGSVLIMSKLFRFSHADYVTLLPKSITTAIGMGVSEELEGIVTITVAVIIITGVLGNVLADFVCKLFHITEPIAKGIGIGSAAHAIGTAKALEMGEVEGAMSSLSIAIAGILTVIMAPLFSGLY